MFGLEGNCQLNRGLKVHHKDQPAWSDAGNRTTYGRHRNFVLRAKLSIDLVLQLSHGPAFVTVV